jgi:AcrR family transcriptional regulator
MSTESTEAPLPTASVDDSPGTRERIQAVALELFTEQGYEATSLREIAERLGVTKAALYYHFKTKEEIVSSLVDRQVANLSELLAWVQQEPRTLDTRREFVRRYAEMLQRAGHEKLIRFFERNPTVTQSFKSGGHMRDRMLAILDILSNRDDPLTDQIRCSLAIFALHATWFVIRDPKVTEEERRAASLEVALDLVTRADPALR